MDLKALAAKLGAAIKETAEYQAVQAARAKVDSHEAARLMLADFKRREEEYRQALLAGKAGEQEGEELRKLAEIVGHNPYLRELFTAEAHLADLVVGLQREMMTAAGLTQYTEEEPAEDAKND